MAKKKTIKKSKAVEIKAPVVEGKFIAVRLVMPGRYGLVGRYKDLETAKEALGSRRGRVMEVVYEK